MTLGMSVLLPQVGGETRQPWELTGGPGRHNQQQTKDLLQQGGKQGTIPEFVCFLTAIMCLGTCICTHVGYHMTYFLAQSQFCVGHVEILAPSAACYRLPLILVDS